MRDFLLTFVGWTITASFILAFFAGIVIASIGGATGQQNMHDLGCVLALAPVFLTVLVVVPALMISGGEQYDGLDW